MLTSSGADQMLPSLTPLVASSSTYPSSPYYFTLPRHRHRDSINQGNFKWAVKSAWHSQLSEFWAQKCCFGFPAPLNQQNNDWRLQKYSFFLMNISNPRSWFLPYMIQTSRHVTFRLKIKKSRDVVLTIENYFVGIQS